jgi:hypothetical protein
MKSGTLNFLETSGPLQACNGTALPNVHIHSNVKAGLDRTKRWTWRVISHFSSNGDLTIGHRMYYFFSGICPYFNIPREGSVSEIRSVSVPKWKVGEAPRYIPTGRAILNYCKVWVSLSSSIGYTPRGSSFINSRYYYLPSKKTNSYAVFPLDNTALLLLKECCNTLQSAPSPLDYSTGVLISP